MSSAWPSAEGEVIVPLPIARERLMPPTKIRSTLIASSIRSLRGRGFFDAYAKKLAPEWRPAILEAVAGVWMPIEAGLAHYEACDSLALTAAEQMSIGREVGDRIHGTFLGTMLRAAKGVGATPWVAFTSAPRLYERLFDGGACTVAKFGPKDARMELVSNPIVRYAYFRNGMRGMWLVALQLFCTKAYVTETGRTDASYRVRMSWA